MPVKLATCIASPAVDVTPAETSSASPQSSNFTTFGATNDAGDDREAVVFGILAASGGTAACLGGLVCGIVLEEDAIPLVSDGGR